MRIFKGLIDWVREIWSEKDPEDIICPVCGYYCKGTGGYGCIDKPFLCGLKDE